MPLPSEPGARTGERRHESGPRDASKRFTGWIVTFALLVAAGTPAAATTGPGVMSVSPGAVLEGSTGNALTFTYSAQTVALSEGTLKVKIPEGWTEPQKRVASGPGYVSAA